MYIIAKVYNHLFLRKGSDNLFLQQVKKNSKRKSLRVSVVTKPLQYMNLKGVIRDKEKFNILIVVGYFSDAESFVQFLKKNDTEWDMIWFFPSEKEAYSSILKLDNITELWVAWDCGIMYNFFFQELHYRNCKIKLIEEGIGNYVDNGFAFKHFHPWLYRHRWFSKITYEFVKSIFYWLSGSGNRLNLSKWLSEVHLFYPEYPRTPCRTKQVLQKIKASPQKVFTQSSKFFDFSKYPWINELYNAKVLIFATSWDDSTEWSPNDLKQYDFLIQKYHPHLKDKNNKRAGKLIDMTGCLPTEILIFRLLAQGCDVTLRSKFTSSMIYLANTSVKLEFKNDIPDYLRPYYEFIVSIKV